GVPDFIDWNGDGKYSDPVTLEGDQCLVFFLGGIPKQGTEPGCLGFSSNRLDPAKIGEAAQRKGPFYAFPGNRLVKRGKTHFYSSAAPFGKAQPYAYFSNFGERNGYHRYGTSDCAGLGVAPYYAELKPPRYYKERSYQIISAGADGVFGPGGRWEPKAPIPAA